MSDIPGAPDLCPISIRSGLVLAAGAWRDDPARPRVSAIVVRHWDALLDEWLQSDDLPLFIRKACDNRGQVLRHMSGRELVPTDNGPAHWSLTLALTGVMPSLSDVRAMINSDRIPVAMAFKRVEKDAARYRCTRAMIDGPNAKGWKVAHIEDVGLGYSGAIETTPLNDLKVHFTRLLAPGNMFLVPKEYAGVAETPEFVAVFREQHR